MMKLKKTLLLLLSPILLIILLTVVGLIIGSRQLISICGLVVFFALFWVFTFTDRLHQWLEAFSRRRFSSRESRTMSVTLQVLSLRLALLIRGFFLAASFWVVSLYLSLCEGGIRAFVEQIRGNFIASAITMVFATIDTARGKSIYQQGLLTRVMSIIGFFQFMGNFILLVSVNEPHYYSNIKKLLSHPIWFVESPLRYELLRFSLDFGVLLTFTVPPALGLITGLAGLSKSADNPDATNFEIALTAICCWLLTLPMFRVYVMVNGVP